VSKISGGNGSQGAPSTSLSHASDLEDRLHEVDGANNFSDGEGITTMALAADRNHGGKSQHLFFKPMNQQHQNLSTTTNDINQQSYVP
jgi:hypothetical protein